MHTKKQSEKMALFSFLCFLPRFLFLSGVYTCRCAVCLVCFGCFLFSLSLSLSRSRSSPTTTRCRRFFGLVADPPRAGAFETRQTTPPPGDPPPPVPANNYLCSDIDFSVTTSPLCLEAEASRTPAISPCVYFLHYIFISVVD